MPPWTSLLLGAGLSSLIGIIAYRRHSLTKSGVVGAVLLGTVLFGFGGTVAGILLVAFFVSSSTLSHLHADEKSALAEKFSKGAQRDLTQALANGGVAALLAIAFYVAPSDIFWAGLVGGLASVNADTWATELGVLAVRRPRLITNLRVVEVGASGGITARGTLAAFFGAFLIALLAGTGWIGAGRPLPDGLALILAGTLGGLVGALFDSLLGATVQSIFYCDVCEKETERHPLHTCGTETHSLRGWKWLNNDGVNFLSAGVGAGVAALLIVAAS